MMDFVANGSADDLAPPKLAMGGRLDLGDVALAQFGSATRSIKRERGVVGR